MFDQNLPIIMKLTRLPYDDNNVENYVDVDVYFDFSLDLDIDFGLDKQKIKELAIAAQTYN